MIRTILLLAAASVPLVAQDPAAPPPVAPPPAPGARTAAVGVYTDSEAVMGESVYRATCSACHTPSDQSGPQFKLNWFGRTVYDYVMNLKKTMPDDNPGGLSDDEYRRVTAYILKLNGFKPGTAPLPLDTTDMKLIKIDSLPPDTTKVPRDTTKPPRTR
ncbi:MAG TPA: cytochrome c [Gemmatimonadaceae bacterium]